MAEITRYEVPYKKTNHRNEMVRVVLLDEKINIMINNIETKEACGYEIAREDVVDFAKALLYAWEHTLSKEKKWLEI